MTRKLIIYLFIIALGYFIVFKFAYKALENERVYTSLFSSFMPTYENQNGAIYHVNKPFSKISEAGYEIMDAAHYAYIKNNLYTVDPNDTETNFNYGFFPLFPIIWKFFSGLGIITLNFFLHFAAIVLLAFTFCRNKIIIAVITVIALPTLTVFLLPYTEALFMFTISLALYGYKEKNTPLYIIGLALSSATRPVFLLFLVTLFVTEIFQYLRNKKTDRMHILISSGTVTLVTLLVSLFQSFFHKGSLFTFMSVQKHWGTFFRIPETINDWSMEGYGMNVWALLFCFVFGTAVLVSTLVKKSKIESNFDYWYYFSWVYLISTCLYVLFFQGGCLHSLYRYTLCSPFFYVILFQHINSQEAVPSRFFVILSILFFIACIIFLRLIGYGQQLDFSKLGFVLLTINLLLYIIKSKLSDRYRYIGYCSLILCGIFWNCYLYNMFFSKAWIFL